MQIKWLDEAVEDLISLKDYIPTENPSAFNRIAKKIIASVDQLAMYPAMGRSGRVLHTREWVVSDTPFIMAYRVHNGVVEILRILHGAMRWPDNF